MLSCVRSLADPAALAEVVSRAYGIRAERCELLRSLANDVYLVVTPGRRYVLKVYGPGGWSLDEVRWEQELTLHLAQSRVAVAPVVPLADGQLAGVLPAPEGPRPYAMTEFVAGSKPLPPYDDALYRDLGRLTARFHRAGDAFTATRARRSLDLEMTLNEPLRLVLPRLADRPDHARLARELGEQARVQVTSFARQGLAWGIRHGDVSPDNLHRTDRGLVLHDFDCAGAGWLAADLVGVRATEHWVAFQSGYGEVRQLPELELAALPWLRIVELIWNLMFHLVELPAYRGTESMADGWVDRELGALREAGALVASPGSGAHGQV